MVLCTRDIIDCPPTPCPPPEPSDISHQPSFSKAQYPPPAFLQPFHRISPPSTTHTHSHTCLSFETDPYFREGSKIHLGE